jgi:hypothetical protein
MLIDDPVLLHKLQRIIRAVFFHELDPDDASEEEGMARLQATYTTDVCVITTTVAVFGMLAIAAVEVQYFDQKSCPFPLNGRNAYKSGQRPAPDNLIE